jgi:hypothetical protein
MGVLYHHQYREGHRHRHRCSHLEEGPDIQVASSRFVIGVAKKVGTLRSYNQDCTFHTYRRCNQVREPSPSVVNRGSEGLAGPDHGGDHRCLRVRVDFSCRNLIEKSG